jgi:type IV pilus assembly protein PilC
MPTFTYLATDNRNSAISGTIEQPDRSAVIVHLVKQGLRPISIKETVEKKSLFSIDMNNLFGSKKVKNEDLVMFTRQLSTMVGAGVPLLRSLNSLAQYSEKSSTLKSSIEGVIENVEAGSSLADALGKYPEIFNAVYVNMVRAGEAAGILDDILKRLAFQQEKSATVKKKIRGAMTYPTVLISITVLAFFGLMLFVVPEIGKIMIDLGGPDAEMPGITAAMLAISNFMINYWYILIGGIAGGVFALTRYLKTTNGRKKFHKFILKLPAIGPLIKKIASARFTRTFSALMGAGVAVLEALDVTAGSIGNASYEDSLKYAIEEIKNGRTLSAVISQDPLFPPIVGQMLLVGEETGQTDTVLVKVADFYEEEVDIAVDSLSSLLEPLMIVVMGGMVGLIAASVMLPIAGLAQTVQ